MSSNVSEVPEEQEQESGTEKSAAEAAEEEELEEGELVDSDEGDDHEQGQGDEDEEEEDWVWEDDDAKVEAIKNFVNSASKSKVTASPTDPVAVAPVSVAPTVAVVIETQESWDDPEPEPKPEEVLEKNPSSEGNANELSCPPLPPQQPVPSKIKIKRSPVVTVAAAERGRKKFPVPPKPIVVPGASKETLEGQYKPKGRTSRVTAPKLKALSEEERRIRVIEDGISAIASTNGKQSKADAAAAETKNPQEIVPKIRKQQKSGIVFLGYQDDQLILEHEHKQKSQNQSLNGSTASTSDEQVKVCVDSPNLNSRKRGRKAKDKDEVKVKVKPETKAKTKRGRGRRGRPRKKYSRGYITSDSEYDEDSGDGADADAETKVEEPKVKVPKPIPPKKQKPRPRPISFSELMEISKNNLKTPIPGFIPPASDPSPQRGPVKRRRRSRVKLSPAESSTAAESTSSGQGRRKRSRIASADIIIDSEMPVLDNCSIVSDQSESKKSDIKSPTKATTPKKKPQGQGRGQKKQKIMSKILIHPLSYLERFFVQERHCFLLRNYDKCRIQAKKIISGVIVKKRSPSVPVTQITQFEHEWKQDHLNTLCAELHSNPELIPGPLRVPMKLLDEKEKAIVLIKHPLLLRNFYKMYYYIKTRPYWEWSIVKRKTKNTVVANNGKFFGRLNLEDCYPEPEGLVSDEEEEDSDDEEDDNQSEPDLEPQKELDVVN